MTIVSILWSFLVNPDIGMFCYWAKLLGFNPINVLNSPTWAMPTVILVSVWKNFGFNMVILLAGLNGIDESYYEAANIDGATGFQKFRESPSHADADVKFYGCELHHRLLPGIRPGIHHDEGRTFI